MLEIDSESGREGSVAVIGSQVSLSLSLSLSMSLSN